MWMENLLKIKKVFKSISEKLEDYLKNHLLRLQEEVRGRMRKFLVILLQFS